MRCANAVLDTLKIGPANFPLTTSCDQPAQMLIYGAHRVIIRRDCGEDESDAYGDRGNQIRHGS